MASEYRLYAVSTTDLNAAAPFLIEQRIRDLLIQVNDVGAEIIAVYPIVGDVGGISTTVALHFIYRSS